MTFLIAIPFVATILTSCDPGHGVILQNNSSKEIKVNVLFSQSVHPNHKILLSDSVTTSFTDLTKKVEFLPDTLAPSRTFQLGSHQSALITSGIHTPDKKLIMIIDDADTITFKSKNRLRREGTSMSKLYVFSVVPEK